MSDEGKENDVEEIQPDKDGKYPETVPWQKYVGIKESLGKKLDAERDKVKSLEESIKNATSEEEVKKLRDELETTKGKLQEKETELTNLQTKTLSEKREVLTKRGLPEDKVNTMSDKELDAAIMALGHSKPASDLSGGGGGSGELTGSPMDLAQRAYANK